MNRRVVAVLATGCAFALAVLAGCAERPPQANRPDLPQASVMQGPAETKTEPPTPTVTPVPTASVLTLPAPARYRADRHEPDYQARDAATAYLEALLTYDAGEEGVSAAQRRLADARLPVGPISDATPLLKPAGPASTSIVYAQSGGLLERQKRIMVVATTSRLAKNGDRTDITRTYDVRLDPKGKGYAVARIASIGGSEPAKKLNVGKAVLRNKNITMPDTAKWDIQRGYIDSRVLSLLDKFAQNHKLSVTVLRTSHPKFSSGTSSVSNHHRGRAVDIWEIDGVSVIKWAQRGSKGNTARDLMVEALKIGSDEVGGPWAFSTSAGRTFTNPGHQDHLHIGWKHQRRY